MEFGMRGYLSKAQKPKIQRAWGLQHRLSIVISSFHTVVMSVLFGRT